jgi:hypothetical protein
MLLTRCISTLEVPDTFQSLRPASSGVSSYRSHRPTSGRSPCCASTQLYGHPSTRSCCDSDNSRTAADGSVSFSKPLHDGDPESLSSHGSPDVHRERSRLTDSGTYETTVSTSLNAYQTTLLCIVLLLSIMAEAKRLLGVATSRSFSDDHGRQRCHYRILP